ncbi:hypothetical protein FIBSPDRAFT_939821 [Athelia psychrophila]|uniref:Uncharacterized protein n=1 Tax=Athelia psychrophila TaxID=1759441 RepID=A0A167X4A8_9AGAM|nr:hypothetical protein FIBSPDRAFT_939821 [Fibularhizoctonia sp. CBS 109695]
MSTDTRSRDDPFSYSLAPPRSSPVLCPAEPLRMRSPAPPSNQSPPLPAAPPPEYHPTLEARPMRSSLCESVVVDTYAQPGEGGARVVGVAFEFQGASEKGRHPRTEEDEEAGPATRHQGQLQEKEGAEGEEPHEDAEGAAHLEGAREGRRGNVFAVAGLGGGKVRRAERQREPGKKRGRRIAGREIVRWKQCEIGKKSESASGKGRGGVNDKARKLGNKVYSQCKDKGLLSSTDAIFNGSRQVPASLNMDMHLLHESYAPNDSHVRSASQVEISTAGHSLSLPSLLGTTTCSFNIPTRCKARGSLLLEVLAHAQTMRPNQSLFRPLLRALAIQIHDSSQMPVFARVDVSDVDKARIWVQGPMQASNKITCPCLFTASLLEHKPMYPQSAVATQNTCINYSKSPCLCLYVKIQDETNQCHLSNHPPVATLEITIPIQGLTLGPKTRVPGGVEAQAQTSTG